MKLSDFSSIDWLCIKDALTKYKKSVLEDLEKNKDNYDQFEIEYSESEIEKTEQVLDKVCRVLKDIQDEIERNWNNPS